MKIDKNKTVLFLIFAVGSFWRFWDYGNRWVLNQDQARDAILARYFWQERIWPQLGPTSSAGAFNFGGAYYYVLMVLAKIPGEAGPWIGITSISCLTILLAYVVGKSILDKKMGLVLAFLVAFSPALITISTDMLNTVLVWPVSLLAFGTLAKFFKTKKLYWIAKMGCFVGLACAFHFQALGLLTLGLVAGLVWGKKAVKIVQTWLLFGLGFLVPFLPNVWFDLNNNGRWIKSVLEYYTVGVHKFYVPIRWLTELKEFWPRLLGEVVSGMPVVGYGLIMFGVVAVVKEKNKMPKVMKMLGVVGITTILLVRYYAGTRSGEYFIFAYPLLLVWVAWVIWVWPNKILPKKIFMILVVLALVWFGKNNWILIHKQSQANIIFAVKKDVDKHVVGKIKFFEKEGANMLALPLMYLYDYEGRLLEDGEKVVTAIGKKGYQVGPYLGNENGALDINKKLIYEWNWVNYPEAKR